MRKGIANNGFHSRLGIPPVMGGRSDCQAGYDEVLRVWGSVMRHTTKGEECYLLAEVNDWRRLG